MSTALTTARDMANMFADAAEQLAAYAATTDSEHARVCASISDDINTEGLTILGLVKDAGEDPEGVLPLVLEAGLQLGERVVFRLSVLLEDEEDERIRMAHLSAVIALTLINTYLSEGETPHVLT